MAEPVRADIESIRYTLNCSHSLWSSYAREAELESQLPLPCFQLRNVLGKTPEFRFFWHNRNEATSHLNLDGDGAQLYGSGRSIWRVSDGVCNLADKESHHKLIFGTTQVTSFTFTDDSRFTNWPNLHDCTGEGNYLSILAFAWAYILSAKWVEVQIPLNADTGWPHSRMQYEQCENQYGDDSSGDIVVDLGSLCDDAARWWAAVLAPGEGWIATSVIEGGIYRSPWSVRISDGHRFTFRRATTNPSFPSQSDPPSSNKAIRYLHDFCIAHNICDQGSAALAAALHFPILTGHALLPLPRIPCTSVPGSPTTSNASYSTTSSVLEHQSILEEYDRLSYYMTLSCNPRGMLALLSGSFFDMAIECNVVSSWLEPIFAIIDPIVSKCDYKTFVTIMAKRQPSLAPFWLGATIVGLERRIIQMARLGTPPVDLHAGAWTATTHSFIGVEPSRPVLVGGEIRRSDECRILFLAGSEDHRKAPICPWQPFGHIRLRDTDMEVQQHVHCGHTFEYAGWKWDLRNGSSTEDKGYMTKTINRTGLATTKPTPSEPTPKMTLRSEVASEVATRSIFSWLRVDGWPAAEREIHTHEWFDFGASDQDSDNGSVAGDDQEGVYGRIENWQTRLEVVEDTL